MFFSIIFQNRGDTGGDMLKVVRITAKQNSYRRRGNIHAYRLRKDTGKWGKIAVHIGWIPKKGLFLILNILNKSLPIIENSDFIVKNKLLSAIFNRFLPHLQPTARRKFHSSSNARGVRMADQPDTVIPYRVGGDRRREICRGRPATCWHRTSLPRTAAVTIFLVGWRAAARFGCPSPASRQRNFLVRTR